MEDGVAQRIRNDGRDLAEFRHFTIETGFLSQTNGAPSRSKPGSHMPIGSARVKLGTTDVIVGVKLETGEPAKDVPDEGRAQFAVEW